MTSESVREYIPWESHHETIFVDWADKAACYKWMHDKSYLKYSAKRNAFTIPVIIMSTLILVTAELLRRRSERLRGINR